jgi:hypothetical protein
MTRYGGKWAALDLSREVESAFYLDEWRLSGKWRFHESKSKVDFEPGADINFLYKKNPVPCMLATNG